MNTATPQKSLIFLISTLLDAFKGSSDPSHSIFEINVGKKRIRQTTTLKLNDESPDRLD